MKDTLLLSVKQEADPPNVLWPLLSFLQQIMTGAYIILCHMQLQIKYNLFYRRSVYQAD